MNGLALRRLVESDDPAMMGYAINYSSRGGSDVSHRVSLIRRGITFHGRIHETPRLSIWTDDGQRQIQNCGLIIDHHGYGDPELDLKKSARNLQLLRLENADRPNDPRTLFYLSSELWKNGLHAEMIGYARMALADPRLEPYQRVHTALG